MMVGPNPGFPDSYMIVASHLHDDGETSLHKAEMRNYKKPLGQQLT
jgi:hypothetical protein